MLQKVVDACLAALKFVTDSFVTNKCLNNVVLLYSLMMILHLLMQVLIMSHFLVMKKSLNIVDLNNINLHDDNSAENDPETIFDVRIIA